MKMNESIPDNPGRTAPPGELPSDKPFLDPEDELEDFEDEDDEYCEDCGELLDDCVCEEEEDEEDEDD